MTDLRHGPSQPSGEQDEIKITTVPHAGHFGLELPVTEFDNTLRTDVASGAIDQNAPDTFEAFISDAPKTIGDEAESDTPASVAPNTPNIPPRTPRNPGTLTPERPGLFGTTKRKIAGAVIGLIGIGAAGTGIGLAVANSSEKDEGPNTPVEEVIDEPVVEQPEVVEPETPTVPENLVQYKEMSPEAFGALPKEEQAPYIQYLYKDLEQFVTDWKNQKSTPNDIYSPATVDDSAQQALANHLWMMRYSLSLDKDDAQKAMTFMLHEGTASTDYQDWVELLDTGANLTAAGMAEGGMIRIDTVNGSDGIINRNGVPVYENISFTAPDGVNYLTDLHFGSFTIGETKFEYWGQINN